MARALVLLHGFTHTGQSWDPVARALGERYRPVAPDLRGHGAARDAQPVSLEAVLGDLDALCAEPVVLAGYSMGGRIALHYALARPGRVERLVLVGVSPGLADPAERAARIQADERLARELERSTIEEFAARWARTPVLADQPDEVRARVHADRLRNAPEALARALRGLGTGVLPPLWDRLGELRTPSLLIAGARDEKFAHIARAMSAAIPRARLELISGAGHAAHLERPQAVAALIASAVPVQ
jgi:2-succinyl-6-hydroxy-2,4-cyclohexadiene-1-carboxylate synthase